MSEQEKAFKAWWATAEGKFPLYGDTAKEVWDAMWQAATRAEREACLQIYIKGFEENWVVQYVIDEIRKRGAA